MTIDTTPRTSPARLPDDTRIGTVCLQVADLERSIAWYRDLLGARLLSHDGSVATLGVHANPAAGDTDGTSARSVNVATTESRPLLELREHPGAAPMPSRGTLGLFHVAWLLPDRVALGRFVRHAMQRGEPLGSADHLVSEALYLHDPDGLGVEVYADRPRATWRWEGGEVAMASLPLDGADLLAAAGAAPYAGLPAGSRIGHVHLHVGALDEALAFYRDTVGLAVTQSAYPGARFLAAGGYHHHLGINTWAGPGAVPPAPDQARLLHWELVLPAVADVAPVAVRAGLGDAEASPPLVLADPWGTAVHVRSVEADEPNDYPAP